MNPAATAVSDPSRCLSIPLWKTLVLLAVGLLTAFGFWSIQSINNFGAVGVSMELPTEIGDFRGTPQSVSSEEKRILPADTEFAKMVYQNPAGQTANVQIVLAGAEKRSIHRPEVCLPAQGWTINSRKVVGIPLSNGRTLEVMRMELAKPIAVRPGELRTLNNVFLYWFVGDHITTPYHWVRLAQTSWDRIVNRRNHRWAYVIVSAPALKGFAPEGMDVAQTEKFLAGFVAEVAPKVILGLADQPEPPTGPSGPISLSR